MVGRLWGSLTGALHADPYRDFVRANTRARVAKLLSPRYLVSKVGVVLYERRHPDHPWLTRDAIERLERYLQPAHRGFEWGSGNGSRWFARRSRSLVSVEHHRAWYERVRRQHEEAGIANVDYRFVDEATYPSAIDAFADETFDYVLVDGLFRDVAFLKSIPKVRRGGLVVFDNANWYLPSSSRTPHSRSHADGPATPIFGEVARRIAGWPTIWTTNGVNDTALFVRPSGEG